MRLVDQGKVKLDDPAYVYADGPLEEAFNTTMQELFGLWADKVTVGDLIFMKSGINDFEEGTFDQDLILPENSHKIQPPIDAFKFVGELPEKSPCST
jgi:CubicO group peptidase (beta-lactamase class C family)